MRLFTRPLLVWSVLIGLTACVDEVGLPIRQVQPRLVVEGLITNEPPPYWVKLTYSGQFSSLAQLPEALNVNGALVTVSDDQGRSVRLRQDPLAPAYYYLRDSTFRGQPGRMYTLRIRLNDGTTFVSEPERLPVGSAIDRLDAEYRMGTTGTAQPDGYQVLLDTRDPSELGNYYRWSAFVSAPCWPGGVPRTFEGVTLGSTYVTRYGPLTDVLSDALINGNRISRRPVLTVPIYAIGQQYVTVRQYSLTREAFQYWTLFGQQVSRTGSLFDPQPASIEGNVHQEDDSGKRALGYFGASAVSQQQLTIDADTINYNRFIIRYGGLFAGSCGP